MVNVCHKGLDLVPTGSQPVCHWQTLPVEWEQIA